MQHPCCKQETNPYYQLTSLLIRENTITHLNNIAFIGFSDPFSSMTHLLGAVLFLFWGIVILKKHHHNLAQTSATIIFIIAVIFTLSMSGVYHLLTPATMGRDVLQRLDHAGIFFLIAASFTPIHILLFRGPMRWAFLTAIWAIAITGITLKTIYFTDMSEWLGMSIYIGLGWMGSVTGYLLFHRYGRHFIRHLLNGALAYTAGAILDYSGFPVVLNRVVGPHEIFHIAVLLGITFHWLFIIEVIQAAVIRRIELPTSNKLSFD